MDRLVIEIDREDDGRWIADVVGLPGAMAYGASRKEAIARAEALAERVLAERSEERAAEDRDDLVAAREALADGARVPLEKVRRELGLDRSEDRIDAELAERAERQASERGDEPIPWEVARRGIA